MASRDVRAAAEGPMYGAAAASLRCRQVAGSLLISKNIHALVPRARVAAGIDDSSPICEVVACFEGAGGAQRLILRRRRGRLSRSREALGLSNEPLPTPPTASLRAQESPRTRQKTRYNPHGRDIDDNHKLFRLARAASAASVNSARAAAILETLGNEGLPP